MELEINSTQITGKIDPLLYGQLFEHIYFSANNGVWQELIFERSFETEQFPGIHPRDGYFDGWFADDEDILHSPTRYEQPISLTSVDTDSYDIEMDVKWRSYKLPGRMWSGGLMDLRFAFKNQASGEPYLLRITDPKYEAKRLELSQTQAQIDANNRAKALEKVQKQASEANFSISVKQEKQVPGFGGNLRNVVVLDPLKTVLAKPGQIEENEAWHKLKISCRGRDITVKWDGKKVLSYKTQDNVKSNDIVLWENYTEACYRNITVKSPNGRTVYFSGMPDDVKTPAVAPQWTSFGAGDFSLVKGDAVNMNYSQKITSSADFSGVCQGPQAVRSGDWVEG